MSLSDLKKASAARLNQEEGELKSQLVQQSVASRQEVATVPKKVRSVAKKPVSVMEGRTKMLGARVPLAIHRELQQRIFLAQEEFPDLTIQDAIPALIRLLRDEKIWAKFMTELEES